MAAVVLDSGAVIAFLRGDRDVTAIIKKAMLQDVTLFMPPIVVTQTIRGGGRDARIYRLLNQGCTVPVTDLSIARRAGGLLGATGASDAADAQVAAHCIDAAPATLVTSEPDDMRRLLASLPSVRVRAVEAL
ncbi:MAG: PIN domain-containing protein, partial [Chloroflexota bacterium]